MLRPVPLAAVLATALTTSLTAQCEMPGLLPSDSATFASFGSTVAVHGDTAVVGAPDYASGLGRVSIFRRNGPGWTLELELEGADSVIGDRFGHAVDVWTYDDHWHGGEDARRIAVTAPGKDLPGMREGGAYLYESRPGLTGGAWTLVDSIEDPGSTTTVGEFGASVALSRSHLFVGSPQDDASGSLAGCVRSYHIAGDTSLLSLGSTLTPPSAYSYQRFGATLANGPVNLVVGAPADHPFSSGAGSVHAYWLTEFEEPEYRGIFEPELIPGLGFGSSVATHFYGIGAMVIAGAPMLDGSAPGRVYVTQHWEWWGALYWDSEPLMFEAPTPAIGDGFGSAVAFDGKRLVVGAPGAGEITQYELIDEMELEYRGQYGDGQEDLGAVVAAAHPYLLAGLPSAHTDTVSFAGRVRAFSTGGELCPELCDAPRLPLGGDVPEAVAVDGSLSVFGAPSAGVGGAAHVMRRDQECWVEEPLPAHGTLDAGDSFGAMVDIDNDFDGALVLVGAPTEDPFGVTSPDPGPGGAHLFRRVDGMWTNEANLYGTGVPAGGAYGSVGAVSNQHGPGETPHYAVVGYTDFGGNGAVRAWTEVAPGSWSQASTLWSPNYFAGDRFGAAIDTDEGYFAVGAPGEGAVHFYRAEQGTYNHLGSLAAPAGLTDFGAELEFGHTTLLVSSPADERVFLFVRTGDWNEWVLSSELTPPVGSTGVGFGADVSLDDKDIYVSAPGSNEVYHYYDGWMLLTLETLRPALSAGGDEYGAVVDARFDRVVVGAPGADAGYVYDTDADPQALQADQHAISLGTGGVQAMQLDAGVEHAGEFFWMFGSLAGEGSTPFFGADVPLAFDPYFNLTLNNPGGAPVLPTIGVLDGAGKGQAVLALPPMNPEFAGLWAYHAFVTLWDGSTGLVSNAEHVKLVP